MKEIFVPTGLVRKMDPSEYVPIIFLKDGAISSGMLHKNDTLMDAITQSGYPAYTGRIKMIVDENDSVLTKISMPLHLSLAAVSEGYIHDPSLFHTPEQVRIKALEQYVALRGQIQEGATKRVCLFDVHQSSSRLLDRIPTFAYDPEKNYAIYRPRSPSDGGRSVKHTNKVFLCRAQKRKLKAPSHANRII